MTRKHFSSPIFIISCCFLIFSSIAVQPALSIRAVDKVLNSSSPGMIVVKPSPSSSAPRGTGRCSPSSSISASAAAAKGMRIAYGAITRPKYPTCPTYKP